MKRTISVLLIILSLLTLASCKKEDDGRVEMGSAEEVEAKIGGTFFLPKGATVSAFYVIDDVVGEAEFGFNGFIFIYRASKIKSGVSLHEVEETLAGTTKLQIDSRAEVTLNSYDNGSRHATWIHEGTSYSL